METHENHFDTPQTKKRRWFQFSLLTLLILVAVVAVGTKWWMGPHRVIVQTNVASSFKIRHSTGVSVPLKKHLLPIFRDIYENYGVIIHCAREYEYRNSWNGKIFDSVSLPILPAYGEFVDSPYYSHYFRVSSEIMEYADLAKNKLPSYDEHLCLVLVKINSILQDEWQHKPVMLFPGVQNPQGNETVYISNKSKIYRAFNIETYHDTNLYMQEIQLADVSPELRPRVEEELQKLKAE